MAQDCTPGCQSPCNCLLIGSPASSAPTARPEITSCQRPVASLPSSRVPHPLPGSLDRSGPWSLPQLFATSLLLHSAPATPPSLLFVDSGPLNVRSPCLECPPLDFQKVSLTPPHFFQTSSETPLLSTLAKTALPSPCSPHCALIFKLSLSQTSSRLLVDYPLIAYLPSPRI